jgi:sugar phosphate isomerase/epimerase
MKYSVFTLSLPECTPSEAAKLIKEAGYDGVEWRCTDQPETLPPTPNPWTSNRTTLDVKKWRNVVKEYKKITKDNGLEFSNLGSYCRANELEKIQVV